MHEKHEKAIRLRSGFEMPVLGLGTWELTGRKCTETVKKALEMGYKHIDTAEYYGNEKETGRAISGFDRSEIFITSKVWMTHLKHDDVIKACEASLKRLGTSYLDLYLIHWPNEKISLSETMKAMEHLVKDGKVRSVGISNFDIKRTREALEVSSVPVSNNQVEFHPHLYQKGLLEFCKKSGIAITAYCPLARGKVLKDPVITGIAEKYGRTPAQVTLRWLLQKGTVVIPKASSEQHLKENMNIFGWKLKKEDESRIDSIVIKRRQIDMGFADF